jgi:hypothetical protein
MTIRNLEPRASILINKENDLLVLITLLHKISMPTIKPLKSGDN